MKVMSDELNIIHTYADDSQLIKISLASLLALKPWSGQRLIVPERVDKLATDVGNNVLQFDRDFKLMKYTHDDGESPIYIIDGQHRIEVIKRYFAKKICSISSDVTATLYTLDNEESANALFRKINNVMAIDIVVDHTLEINEMVENVEKQFGKQHVRPDRIRRPYLSSDIVRTWIKSLFDSERYGITSKNVINTLIKVNLSECMKFKKFPPKKLPSEKSFTAALDAGFILPWTSIDSWTTMFDIIVSDE